MQYSMSFDEENYNLRFDTLEEAVAEAANRCLESDDTKFWIGEIVPPRQPEEFFSLEDVIENADGHEDYGGEWAADWYIANREQVKEVEASVKAVIGAWLDKHKLRPKFWNIDGSRRYDMVDGHPVLFTKKKDTAAELQAKAGL